MFLVFKGLQFRLLGQQGAVTLCGHGAVGSMDRSIVMEELVWIQ